MFVEHKEHGEPSREHASPSEFDLSKLSGLIRKGCLMAPTQLSGTCWDNEGGACAIGAAHIASGRKLDWHEFCLSWYGPMHARGVYLFELYERNDRGETREQIADWLESQGL
jgi:hypothetical protein